MDKKEEFKGFVKENPRLIQFVRNGDMTWQKFYEIYDLYGKEHTVWDEYIKPKTDGTSRNTTNTANATAAAAGTVGLAEIFQFMKQIDLDSIQNSVSSVQRVLGVLQEFGTSKDTPKKENYKPRPIYKHFED